MKGLKKKRRVQVIIVAFVALAISTGLIGYAMRDGINFFKSPSQIVEDTPPPTQVLRVGGLVEEGSLKRGQGEVITFNITDGGATIKASYAGVLPDLFKEGQGTVATGSYVNGVFQATEILAKHDENYMPKEVVDALKEQGYYVDPEDQANGS
ncbi:cytochrome c maturation protein CcmE [Profundibacter amoris]|uniref:Cytochrome c-type biogenesis protein CcmE n=1 Tax=Profundibacter amoris TaxID=2171755 RepID=A0A347UH99_9RHOB|nr:cytochrome c maturation protein CcmE [Profundibacter amoris]AXX98227.1 cytochrome c maturation protein CcmE [Profundibacter amoris]